MTADPTQQPAEATTVVQGAGAPVPPAEGAGGVTAAPTAFHIPTSHLDAALQERVQEAGRTTRTIELFGQTFRLAPVVPMNAMLIVSSAETDPAAVGNALKAFFHDEDREAAFRHLTSRTFDSDYLQGLLKVLTEAFTGRPTDRSEP